MVNVIFLNFQGNHEIAAQTKKMWQHELKLKWELVGSYSKEFFTLQNSNDPRMTAVLRASTAPEFLVSCGLVENDQKFLCTIINVQRKKPTRIKNKPKIS